MARTKEGKVKARLSKLLGFYGAYYFMPVQNGYGAAALDYIVCSGGRYAQIEVKAGDGEMTPRQQTVAILVENAGGNAFLINDTEESFTRLTEWLALN